jgi:hypothetical protein
MEGQVSDWRDRPDKDSIGGTGQTIDGGTGLVNGGRPLMEGQVLLMEGQVGPSRIDGGTGQTMVHKTYA